MSEYKTVPVVRIVTAWRKHGVDAEREGNRLTAVNPSVGREMLRDAAQWRSCADTLEREALAAAPQDCAVDDDSLPFASLRNVLFRAGFVPCDIAACNCGSWHHRYGLPERFTEIREVLQDAEVTSGFASFLIIDAVRKLIEQRDKAYAALSTRPAGLTDEEREAIAFFEGSRFPSANIDAHADVLITALRRYAPQAKDSL